jgi:hypothetical protein
MKRTLIAGAICVSFLAGAAFADRVRDWHDLDDVHDHIVAAIHDMEHAQKANHYDMGGHAAKAEEHLRAAERELHDAIEWAHRH